MFFEAAIFWAEEAMVYLAIWAIFLAAIAVAYDRAESDHGLLLRVAPEAMEAAGGRGHDECDRSVCLFMATQSSRSCAH